MPFPVSNQRLPASPDTQDSKTHLSFHSYHPDLLPLGYGKTSVITSLSSSAIIKYAHRTDHWLCLRRPCHGSSLGFSSSHRFML
jgi:hypothetical protein